MTKEYKYSLDTFAGGALLEQFNDAMDKIAANIADPNTSFKVKRGLSISFVFVPDESREIVGVETSVVPKLASVKGFPATILIDRDRDGKVSSAEFGRATDRNQVHLEVAPSGDVSIEVPSERPKLPVVNQ